MEQDAKKNAYNVLKVVLIILTVHVFGVLFPERFWGVHFPSFLSTQSIFMLYASVLMLLAYPFWYRPKFRILEDFKLKWILPFAGAFVVGVLFYVFPLYHDVYGDAHFLKPGLENSITEMSDTLWSYIFSFDLLDPKVGGKTTSGIIGGLSYLTGATGQDVYIAFDAFCGMAFVFLWMRLVVELLTKNSWRIVLGLVGMFAPFMFMFYGHVELYALPILGSMAYMLAALFYLKRKKRVYLWLAIVLTILAIKFHITSFLLVPVTGFLFLLGNADKLKFVQSLLEPKQLLKKVVAPIYVLGIIVFFYHTRANGSKRSFTEETLESALFIPFSSSEPAPLDRYNLFSGAHLSDYLNLIFVWSSAAVFIIVLALTVGKRWVNWKNPLVAFAALPVLIYVAVFFVLNPLLTMSIDWDLFSLPAPFVLVFALVLASYLEKEKLSRFILGAIAALTVFGIPVIAVNANQEPLANRLESVALWDFKTYWIGTSYLIEESIGLREDDQQLHRLRILEELEPHAVKENDLEYAEVLCNAGIYSLEEKKDADTALIYFERAKEYKIEHIKNLYYLTKTRVAAGAYKEAREFSGILVNQQYPNLKEALMLAIETSIRAEEFAEAQAYCRQYLLHWADDSFVTKVNQMLVSEREFEEVRQLFGEN